MTALSTKADISVAFVLSPYDLSNLYPYPSNHFDPSCQKMRFNEIVGVSSAQGEKDGMCCV